MSSEEKDRAVDSTKAMDEYARAKDYLKHSEERLATAQNDLADAKSRRLKAYHDLPANKADIAELNRILMDLDKRLQSVEKQIKESENLW